MAEELENSEHVEGNPDFDDCDLDSSLDDPEPVYESPSEGYPDFDDYGEDSTS
jgi:hypothetical protein